MKEDQSPGAQTDTTAARVGPGEDIRHRSTHLRQGFNIGIPVWSALVVLDYQVPCGPVESPPLSSKQDGGQSAAEPLVALHER